MRKSFLKDAQAGDVVEDVFVFTNKQLAATTSNKHYIKCFVSDRSGQFTGRVWNATRELFADLPDSGFVRLRGRVENYQNNLQVIIEQLWPAKAGTYDIADLLPVTPKDVPMMRAEVVALMSSLRDKPLQALVSAFLEDGELMENFCRAPAATTFHHAYIGGLLEHTWSTLKVTEAVVPFYPGLSRDLCLAGVFLHDIAKTWELAYGTAFSYTDGGQLVGHVVKAALWVEEKAGKLACGDGPQIPRATLDVLQHILLSHHGLPEFGAARTPSTPEAIFVHTIENLDAKLMMAMSATRGEGLTGEGNWTEYMKAFSGRLYRPDPTAERLAPAPAAGPNVIVIDATAPAAAAAKPAAPAVPAAPPKLNNPMFETVPKRN